jgi:hypothetical protein
MLLSSCFPAILMEDDIVGLWVEAKYSPTIGNGENCASIEFLENGQFEAHSLPKDYFTPAKLPPNARVRVDASGEWLLRSPSSDPYKNREIELIITKPDALYNSLMLLTTIGEPMLYAGFGDLSDSVIFTQKRDEWCKERP